MALALAREWTEQGIIIEEIKLPGEQPHYYLSDKDNPCNMAVFQPNWSDGRYADGWLVVNDWELMVLKKSVPDAITAFSRWLNKGHRRLDKDCR